MKKVILLVFTITFLLFEISAQKGTLKIFCEIKGVSVFINEIPQGVDVSEIKNLDLGKHYLKVVKDNVIIYGELISIAEDSPTFILIKDNKEIQDKLLAGKYREQQIYISKRIDVLEDIKYVTQTQENKSTSSQANSVFFPGYYSVLGSTANKTNVQTNSVSVTSAVKEWFITEGGTKKLTHYEFARLVGDTAKLMDFENRKIIDANNSRKWKPDITPISVGLGFMLLGGIPLLNTPIPKSEDEGKVLLYILMASSVFVGSIPFLVGIFYHTPRYITYFQEYTLHEAILLAEEYNRNLKLQLKLPESFEPEKK